MKQTILLDGAMGTELMRHGIPLSACLEVQSLERPQLVREVHGAYRRAGAEVLTTNTFGANRFRLAAHGLEGSLREINRAGVRLARQAAAGAQVAASLGPPGQHASDLTLDEIEMAYEEQASALEEEGVDAFSLETFGDLSQLHAAILGVRGVTEKPVWVQMVFGEDGRTPTGMLPREVASALADLRIDAIGTNCAVGEGIAERTIEQLAGVTDCPLIARPNAGQPELSDGSPRYPIGPEQFADLAARIRDMVSMVGGCCGTTPAYIETMARAGFGTGH